MNILYYETYNTTDDIIGISWGSFDLSKCSRHQGPAYVSDTGTVMFTNTPYFCNRNRGPCVIDPDGHIRYFEAGFLHRTDGPAIIKSDGRKKYYVKGEQMDLVEFFMKYGKTA